MALRKKTITRPGRGAGGGAGLAALSTTGGFGGSGTGFNSSMGFANSSTGFANTSTSLHPSNLKLKMRLTRGVPVTVLFDVKSINYVNVKFD
jgi:hypothetical protein